MEVDVDTNFCDDGGLSSDSRGWLVIPARERLLTKDRDALIPAHTMPGMRQTVNVVPIITKTAAVITLVSTGLPGTKEWRRKSRVANTPMAVASPSVANPVPRG